MHRSGLGLRHWRSSGLSLGHHSSQIPVLPKQWGFSCPRHMSFPAFINALFTQGLPGHAICSCISFVSSLFLFKSVLCISVSILGVLFFTLPLPSPFCKPCSSTLHPQPCPGCIQFLRDSSCSSQNLKSRSWLRENVFLRTKCTACIAFISSSVGA